MSRKGRLGLGQAVRNVNALPILPGPIPPSGCCRARALYHSAARLKEAGRPFVKEAAMSKLYTSQVGHTRNGADRSID